MSNRPGRIDRELMRGAGPVAVLKLLSRGEMYGYELTRALASTTDGVLDIGQATLYPLLYNLEAKGLVRSVWRAATGGRRRKYYALTETGRRKLRADVRQWRALVDAMQTVGVLSPEAGES